jgi:hypothetical protein
MPKKKEVKAEIPRKIEINLNELLTKRNTSPTMLEPAVADTPTIYRNVALIEFVNSRILDEVIRATNLKDLVVRRLSETVIVIDQQNQEELIKTLTKKGYEPKIIIG